MTNHLHRHARQLSEAKFACSSHDKTVTDRILFRPDRAGIDGIKTSHRDHIVDAVTDEMYKLAVWKNTFNKTETQ